MSNQNLVAMRTTLLVAVAVGARPVGAGDGVDITKWRTSSPFGSPIAAVMLDGTVAADVSSPAGGTEGVELWGQVLSKWYRIGILNNGATIHIVGVGQGFAQELDVIGIFDRLAVAGTASAGAVTASLAPMESYS